MKKTIIGSKIDRNSSFRFSYLRECEPHLRVCDEPCEEVVQQEPVLVRRHRRQVGEVPLGEGLGRAVAVDGGLEKLQGLRYQFHENSQDNLTYFGGISGGEWRLPVRLDGSRGSPVVVRNPGPLRRHPIGVILLVASSSVHVARLCVVDHTKYFSLLHICFASQAPMLQSLLLLSDGGIPPFFIVVVLSCTGRAGLCLR